MSNNEFLMAHGEKLALVAVVGLSAWAVSGTISNPEVHPKNVSELVINDMIGRIENARRSQPAPQIKTPPDYVASLKRRLDGELPAPGYLPWLTCQPDVGPTIGFNQPLYIYELMPPKVTGRDMVGTIELLVTMPEPIHPPDGQRIADNAKREWKAQGGKVMNTAERAGVYIEYCIGNPNGTFKPLEAEGIIGGFAPMPDSDHPSFKVDFKADAVWETYYLKIKLVARTTAYPLGRSGIETSPQAVLVSQGRYGAVANWGDLEGKVRKGDPDTIGRFLKPVEKPFEVKAGENGLKPGEAYFVSNDTSLSVAVTSATRFAFDKSITFDDNAMGAAMLVTTLLPPLPGAALQGGQANVAKWLYQPETFKIKKGEKLGGPKTIPDPRKPAGVRSSIDLSTPFVLDEIKGEVERTLYYELDTISRPTGGGQRDLTFKPKIKTTETAVLKNAATGQTRAFARLIRIEKPFPKLPGYWQLTPGNWIKLDGPFIYPDFDGLAYDEDAEFRKKPDTFKQRDLVPPPPMVHAPDTGPILAQRKLAGDDYQTDTKYLEFADGRVFFWDPVNKRIVGFAVPDSEADRAYKTRRPGVPPPAAPPAPVAPPTPRRK